MRATAPALALLGAAALGLCGTTAAYAAQTASASGAGALDNGQRHFSFSAKQRPDGTVTGQAQLTNKSFTGENDTSPYKLHLDISCMNRIGNTVFFGGTTKSTNDPNLVDAAYFAVQDNGEPGKGVDKISRVFFFDDDPTTTGDPQACQFIVPGDFPLETIETGNIQVK
jgi:hypothetical protein